MPALCSTYMVWPCWLSICTPEGVNPTLYSKIRRSLGMPIFIFPSCENPVIRVNLDQINRAEYPRLRVFRPDRWLGLKQDFPDAWNSPRSEEHTSELQSRPHLVCRLLLEKKKK